MSLEIGKKVYLKAIGNNARRDKQVRIEEYEITKVGRKYYEVTKEDSRFPVKFYIEDNIQVMDYPDWQLYFSLQEYEDEKEHSQLSDEIGRFFRGYGKVKLTLEQLREINKIIR